MGFNNKETNTTEKEFLGTDTIELEILLLEAGSASTSENNF
jgi:hypothetical protein